jgi:hypothetical protein
MRRIWFIVLIVATAHAWMGCKKKEGGGSGAWLVGEDGAMFNIAPDSSAPGSYGLEVDYDLLGIACRGASTAWVVGELGTLLRTFDAGASWQHIDLSTTSTLRDVAAASRDVVYVVGDGLVLLSRDSGDSFEPVEAPALEWLSVSTNHDGSVALLSASDGSIWRRDDRDGELTRVWHEQSDPIYSVALTHDGRFAAAVGAGGALLASYDGGLSFTARSVPVSTALHAAWITDDGFTIFAVGVGGVLVRSRADSSSTEMIAPAVTLRAIHLSADGVGLVVGDHGTALRTLDRGHTWTPIEMSTDRRLYAVDELHPFGHL